MRKWGFAYYDNCSIFRRFVVTARTKQDAVGEAFELVRRRQTETVLVWCCVEI